MNVNDVRSAVVQTQILRQGQKRAEIPFQEAVKENSPGLTAGGMKESPPVLTDSERHYFEHVFPDATEEVRSYNPYRRDGATVSVQVGSRVDRKG